MPAIGRVDDSLDARVGRRDLPGHLRADGRRGVINDEHADVESGLFVGRAAHGLAQKMAVVVARNNNAHRTHLLPSGASPPRTQEDETTQVVLKSSQYALRTGSTTSTTVRPAAAPARLQEQTETCTKMSRRSATMPMTRG